MTTDYSSGLIKLGENRDDWKSSDSTDSSDSHGDKYLAEYYKNDNPKDDSHLENGKRVDGPRTKLDASDDRIERLQKALETLAGSVATIAKGERKLLKGQRQLQKHMFADAEDEQSGGDEFGGYDDDPMGDAGGDMGGEEQDPCAICLEHMQAEKQMGQSGQGGQAGGGQMNQANQGMMRMSLAQMSKGEMRRLIKAQQAQLRKAKLDKDDAASSFGEKDDDTPGNRPFDPKETEEDYTVIQGGPSDGPGPVSKALDARVQKAVQAEITRMQREGSIIMKATPRGSAGTSPAAAAMETEINKGGLDDAGAFDAAKKLSFHELNRGRVELGLLSGGII